MEKNYFFLSLRLEGVFNNSASTIINFEVSISYSKWEQPYNVLE
jgi:hypothetical protein